MKFKLNRQATNQSEAGLAGLEMLMVLAALLLVAGSGLVVYQRQHRTVASQQAAASSAATPAGTSTSPGGIPGGASQSGASSATSSSSTSSSSKQISFKIAEAGLQLSLPSSLSDLTYHVTSGSPLRLTFSTKSLSAAVPACAASQNNGAFDVILRGSGTYQPPANPSSGALLKQYNNYYFAYLLPTAPCAKGLSTANQVLLDDQAQAFYNALPSAKAL